MARTTDAEEGETVITRARSIGIYVTDQERALAFYRDTLGFEVLMDTPMGDMGPPGHEDKRWISVAPKGAETGFVLYTPPGLDGVAGAPAIIYFHGCTQQAADVRNLGWETMADSRGCTMRMR